MQKLDIKNRRDYISWNAYNLFNKDRRKYINQYMYGMPGYHSDAMSLGTAIHNDIQNGTNEVEGVDLVRGLIPDYKEVEHLFKVRIEGITLLGYIDLFSETKKQIRIGEIKTGTKLWNKRQAENLGQLVFYNLAMIDKKKEVETILYSIRTVIGRSTGELKIHKVKIKRADMYQLFADIKRTQKEIDELWDEAIISNKKI